jgi:hypothetical protein
LLAVSAAGFASTRAATRPCEKPPDGRNLVLIDAHTAQIEQGFPDVDGNVNSIVADGRGGFFVAGTFRCVGSTHVNGLVRLNRGGTLDTSWRAALPLDGKQENGYGQVMALQLAAGQLYAGGSFGVEALDPRSGARHWLTVANTNGGSGVQAVAANTQRVYVGGTFSTVAGRRHPALAVLSAQTGRPVRWNAPTLATWPGQKEGPYVEALALRAGKLFLGSDVIVRVDGKKRPGIAVLDARSGALTPWLPPFENGYSVIGDVGTILVAGGRVFTAGHDGFGITNAVTGKADPLMAEAGGYVFAANGRIAYLAGNCRNSFSSVEGEARNNLGADRPRDRSCGRMGAERREVLVCERDRGEPRPGARRRLLRLEPRLARARRRGGCPDSPDGRAVHEHGGHRSANPSD